MGRGGAGEGCVGEAGSECTWGLGGMQLVGRGGGGAVQSGYGGAIQAFDGLGESEPAGGGDLDQFWRVLNPGERG